jgi:hypothetical protein
MLNKLRVTVSSRNAGDSCRASEIADVRQSYARLALSMKRKKEQVERDREVKKKRQGPKELQMQEQMSKLTRQITL